MIKKVYYYTLKDIWNSDLMWQFKKLSFEDDLLSALLDLGNEDIAETQLPDYDEDLADELYSLVCGRYYNLPAIKFVKNECEEAPQRHTQEYIDEVHKWGYRYLSLFNETYDYYATLLLQYAGAKDSLMADIKATSKNKVKFNDTPQNTNVSGTYEGDNYITHFTSTEGENSSPLMSKIMRLKEIQDNYRDLMSEWVNDFRRIFYEEDC